MVMLPGFYIRIVDSAFSPSSFSRDLLDDPSCLFSRRIRVYREYAVIKLLLKAFF
jgi:hypothetical protein